MNLLKYVPQGLTSKVGRQVLVASKHSPKIMFGVGIAGVVSTAVFAAKGTLRLEYVLAEAESKLRTAKEVHENPPEGIEYSDQAYLSDRAIILTRTAGNLVKIYWPALVSGVVTVGALTGSHVVLNRRNTGLMAAYAAIEKGFSEYRTRVADELGEDKEREFRYGTETREVAKDTKQGTKIEHITHVGPEGASIYAKFFDEGNSNWSRDPEYSRVFLQAQQAYYNNRLQAKGYVFLNEVYEALGLERTRAGQTVGWIVGKDGKDNFIDFGLFANRPVARDFINGREGSILLDFNVDGIILDKI